MTSFVWKRKSSSVHKNGNNVRAFDTSEQVEDDNVTSGNEDDFDWISLAKKKRVEALEDNKTLYNRLKREGVTLAEEEKYWQAINRQGSSIFFTVSCTSAASFGAKKHISVQIPL